MGEHTTITDYADDGRIEITLSVPAADYDHFGSAVAMINDALRQSEQYGGTLPIYETAAYRPGADQ